MHNEAFHRLLAGDARHDVHVLLAQVDQTPFIAEFAHLLDDQAGAAGLVSPLGRGCPA